MITAIDETTSIGSSVIRPLFYVAAAAVAIQTVHFIEHLAQLGYWFLHPGEAPWLTPWAAAGRDGLAPGGNLPVGNELLHLIGNGLFMAGLVAMLMLCVLTGQRLGSSRRLVAAVSIQGFHVVEHVLLTVSAIGFGKAMGFSTFFGAATGSFGSSYRVWFHFGINLAATVFALLAFKELFGRWTATTGPDRRLGRHSVPA